MAKILASSELYYVMYERKLSYQPYREICPSKKIRLNYPP